MLWFEDIHKPLHWEIVTKLLNQHKHSLLFIYTLYCLSKAYEKELRKNPRWQQDKVDIVSSWSELPNEKWQGLILTLWCSYADIRQVSGMVCNWNHPVVVNSARLAAFLSRYFVLWSYRVLLCTKCFTYFKQNSLVILIVWCKIWHLVWQVFWLSIEITASFLSAQSY